jgi:hypothetical protein
MKSHTIMVVFILALGVVAQAQDVQILLNEDFEGLALGPNVDEGTAGDTVWTDTPPVDWAIDESGVPGIGDPATDGVTEWAGWAFANKEWWIDAAGDQRRVEFELGQGTVAVADPDEWDDAGHDDSAAAGWYKTFMSTSAIDLSTSKAGTVQLRFDSSWRPEFDGNYHQTGNLTVSFDGAEPIELFLWESDSASPNFKDDDSTNETIFIDIDNPAEATSMVLTFGLFDAGNDWWWAIDNVMVTGHRRADRAYNPSPRSGTEEVAAKTVLGWTPGEYVGGLSPQHKVILSDNYDAVLDGTAVVATLDDNSFDATGLLDFSTTYYWRVDEANRTSNWDEGSIWQFTVESLSYPISGDLITATASSANPEMGASKTIDGSGLNELDQHSADPLDMWLTATEGSWIQYELDKPYKLHQMLVWNSNQAIEAFLGFGIKEVVVEISVDGETWTTVEGVEPFSQAGGTPTYTANTTVDFAGMMAKFVKITPVSAYGFAGQSGLSEVRFLYIPTAARDPYPAHEAISDELDVTLQWRAGRNAAAHEVYFSDDPAAIADGSALVATVSEAQYAPSSLLHGKTYYWQIIEVNDADVPTAHVGDVWSFTAPQYSSLDDFESYSGMEGEEIFMIWWDGFGGDTTLGGSTTGYIDGPFVETSIVNPGTGSKKSMPMIFDNDGGFSDIDGNAGAPRFSEVMREFDSNVDVTAGDAEVLAVSFRGLTDADGPVNGQDPLYLTLEDSTGKSVTVIHPDAAAIQAEQWQDWLIPLTEFSTLRLTSIKAVRIGVGYKNGAQVGSQGTLFIDDLRIGKAN